MPPKSISRESKKEVQDAESDASNSNNIAPPKPTINAKSNARKIESLSPSNSNDSASIKSTNKKQPRKRTGDTSTSTTNSTTNEPSSTSTSIVRAGQPVAAAAAADATTAPTSTAPLSGQKKRKAGFREQFLQKLRVMLDRESQNDDTTVQWSTDGNSFIITDQTQFEKEIIPTYFGNPIVFASFLRKLQRWGFVRLSSKRSGRYEFSSPTFKRMDSRGTPAAAAAAAATNTTANAVENDPQQQQQQQEQQQQEQAMAQRKRHPMPVPNQLPRQADASAIADLISNIQRQRSTQQPSTSTPQPGPNLNSILQQIIGSNQHQPTSSQNSVPNQQLMPNLTSLLNNAAGRMNHLQSFPQWQYSNNLTMHLLNAALQSLGRGPTPPAQAMGQYPVPSAQSNADAVHALMSLSGMLPQSPPLNTAPAATQSNNMEPILLLLLALQRFVEEEDQRRAQVDELHHAIIATIGHIVGNNVIAGADGQGGEIITQNMHLRNPTGMTVRVPNNSSTQPNQEGAPLPMAVDNNIQANDITAISQPARRGDTVGARARNNDPVANNGSADDNEERKDDKPLSPRNRRSSDNDEADDDGCNKRLRKKSPPK